jgi:hypothetical protein
MKLVYRTVSLLRVLVAKKDVNKYVKMINPESKHRRCIKRDRKLI